MRARLGEDADVALRVAEDDEVLAEQAETLRVAVGATELLDGHDREPVVAHEFAHRRSLAHLGQHLVVCRAQHDGSSVSCLGLRSDYAVSYSRIATVAIVAAMALRLQEGRGV